MAVSPGQGEESPEVYLPRSSGATVIATKSVARWEGGVEKCLKNKGFRE
jgi:hypothetical protein